MLKYHDLNLWLLPGGFVHDDEALRNVAEKVLYDRTKLSGLFFISISYFWKTCQDCRQCPGDGFYHNRVIEYGLRHLRKKLKQISWQVIFYQKNSQ